MVAFNALMVESKPPIRITMPPPRKNPLRHLDQRGLLLQPEKLPTGHAFALRRAERGEGHQQVDRHDDHQREEHRARDVAFRGAHLLAALGDDLIALEGDERQPHRHEDAAHAVGQKILGEGQMPVGPVQA